MADEVRSADGDSELKQIARGDRALRCGNADDALLTQGLKDVDRAIDGEGIRRIERRQNLRDPADSANFVQSSDGVVDLVLYR